MEKERRQRGEGKKEGQKVLQFKEQRKDSTSDSQDVKVDFYPMENDSNQNVFKIMIGHILYCILLTL